MLLNVQIRKFADQEICRRFHGHISILQLKPGFSLRILDFDWLFVLACDKECALWSTSVVLSFWFILASPWHVKDLAHRQSLGPSAPANITTDNPTTVQHYSPSVVQSKHETTNYPAIVQHYPPSVVQSKHETTNYPAVVQHCPPSVGQSKHESSFWRILSCRSCLFVLISGLS